jgi:hypothetical protein
MTNTVENLCKVKENFCYTIFYIRSLQHGGSHPHILQILQNLPIQYEWNLIKIEEVTEISFPITSILQLFKLIYILWHWWVKYFLIKITQVFIILTENSLYQDEFLLLIEQIMLDVHIKPEWNLTVFFQGQQLMSK